MTMTTDSDPNALVAVHRAPTRGLGELASSLLAAEGIPALLSSVGPLAAYGAEASPVVVRVPALHAGPARELIASWFGERGG